MRVFFQIQYSNLQSMVDTGTTMVYEGLKIEKHHRRLKDVFHHERREG